MQDNPRLGIILIVATTLIFALQDGISRYLAENYNVITIVTIRYVFLMCFVVAFCHHQPGGIKAVAYSSQILLQIGRGLMLAGQICVAILAFSTLGLVHFHAIFASYPLIIMALAVPLLGETVGWRRWVAVLIGLFGVLIILRPGSDMFNHASIYPVIAAFMMASYGLMTRFAARKDSVQTSFFWTAISGGVAMMTLGPFFWLPPVGNDWGWMGLLCLTGASGHYLLIKALDATNASTIQPFTFLQLPISSGIGVLIFADTLDPNLIIGSAIVVGAGIFALQRARKVETS